MSLILSGLLSTAFWLQCPVRSKDFPTMIHKGRNALSDKIASFYDETSNLWRDMHGEHMHHGFFVEGGPPVSMKEAQEEMIERALSVAWEGKGKLPENVLDVGCGVGGSSRYIASKFSCNVTGITLSSVQTRMAQEITEQKGECQNVQFLVRDAMETGFKDNTFDLVWSMESGEHMPDKAAFVSEMVRVCKPGGRVVIVAWCRKEGSLKEEEVEVIRHLSSAYHIPGLSAWSEFENAMLREGILIRREDWTARVSPFWWRVLLSSLRPRNVVKLFRSGGVSIKGAMAIPLMIRGQQSGLIRLVAASVEKRADSTKCEEEVEKHVDRTLKGGALALIKTTQSSRCTVLASGSTSETPPNLLKTLCSFSRLHTVIGTFVSCLSLLITWSPTWKAGVQRFAVVFPCLFLANIFIVGLNQMTDA
jgi:tocopherol O-methyltransferase